jgi:hypothetical protein
VVPGRNTDSAAQNSTNGGRLVPPDLDKSENAISLVSGEISHSCRRPISAPPFDTLGSALGAVFGEIE